jgi:hypothetical protein
MTIPARVAGQTDQFAFTTSGTSIGMTFPQDVVVGNAIAVGASSANVGAGTLADDATLTDGLSNSYDKDLTQTLVDEYRDYIYTGKNLTTGGACTVTYSHAGQGANRRTVCGMEYTASGGLALDQVNSGTGTGTAASSGNITTTVADELLFAMFSGNGANPTWTAGTSWTIRGQDTNSRSAFEERFVTGTGTYVGDATIDASMQWIALVASYYEAGLPPPGANAPTERSHGFNLQQMADAEDEGRFNELDVRNWWREDLMPEPA